MKTVCALIGAFFLFAAIAALVVSPSGGAAESVNSATPRGNRPLLLQAATARSLRRDAVSRFR